MILFFILTLTSTIVCIAATVQIIRWKPKKLKKRDRFPKVSILKPIRGLEPNLERNLRSFFELNATIPFELLMSIKNENDPAVAVVRKLIKKYPNVEARLFVNTPDLGRNPKVSNINYSWNCADSDLVLISDSNVSVPENYLENLIAERQRGAGLVTQAAFGADAATVGGHLDVASVNSFYLKGTAFLQIFGYSVTLGKCMLFSRSQFEALGGLFSVRNYLAEDTAIGEMMDDAGYSVAVAPQLLRQTTVMTTFRSFWDRHVRWARLRKCHFVWSYMLEPLLFESVWPFLLFATAPEPFYRLVALVCWNLQILSNLLIHEWTIDDKSSWKSVRYFLLKDLLHPVIWVAGLVSNRVNWRGNILFLRWGGKLRSRPARIAEVLYAFGLTRR